MLAVVVVVSSSFSGGSSSSSSDFDSCYHLNHWLKMADIKVKAEEELNKNPTWVHKFL